MKALQILAACLIIVSCGDDELIHDTENDTDTMDTEKIEEIENISDKPNISTDNPWGIECSLATGFCQCKGCVEHVSVGSCLVDASCIQLGGLSGSFSCSCSDATGPTVCPHDVSKDLTCKGNG